MKAHTLTAGTIHEGDWLQADLAPGYTLAILDGPYGIGKAGWDRMGVEGLADWYAPHLARVSSLLAPSASLYVWNTAEGWARLDPVVRGLGWTFKSKITWNKGNTQATKGVEFAREWPDVTEVCGYYARNAWDGLVISDDIAHVVGADPRNWVRGWLGAEWDDAGLNRKDANAAIGSSTTGGGMAAHYFGASQWELPTWENFCGLARYASERGAPRNREYFVHPEASDLATTWAMLDAFVASLRAEYEVLRVPFRLPPGITNVWSAPQVQGSERLTAPDGSTLHPCQKPIAFAERMIRASTRPGERVLVPFGGTCREAVVCEWLARSEPEQARRYDVCELNQDPGRDYVAAALAQINGEDPRQKAAGQMSLWGAQ